MFNQKAKDEPSPLTDAIDKAFVELEKSTPNSDEYAKILTSLERLWKLKNPEKENKLSKEAILTVAGNLAGIVMILGFERAHIITSKALSFILKSRV